MSEEVFGTGQTENTEHAGSREGFYASQSGDNSERRPYQNNSYNNGGYRPRFNSGNRYGGANGEGGYRPRYQNAGGYRRHATVSSDSRSRHRNRSSSKEKAYSLLETPPQAIARNGNTRVGASFLSISLKKHERGRGCGLAHVFSIVYAFFTSRCCSVSSDPQRLPW